MTYRGRVKDGAVVLEGGVQLPEGVEVEVEVHARGVDDEPYPSLLERLRPVIGAAAGLPPDAAANVDRDLYGQER